MRKIVIAISFLALLLVIGIGVVRAKTSNDVSLPCVKAAVDKRETAVQTMVDVFYNSTKSALQARKTALLSAWDITNAAQRRAAVRSAWNSFHDAYKNARQVFREAKKAAWSQFTVDRKACKAGSTGENQGLDVNF